eukprot:gene1016-15340_t
MDKLVRKTGGQIDEMVIALIDVAHDKKQEVRDDISRTLVELGKRQPFLVLSSCNSYLNKHQRLIQGHRIVLLDAMARIIRDTSNWEDIDLTKELIHLASSEMTKSKDLQPEWQTAASKVLVALGSKASNDVMDELLQKIVPGTLPHYFVVLTLANLATENVFGVVPFLKDIFSRMLAMLGMVKQDNMRWVFSHCIGCFSEAILDYCANIENAPYPDITKDRFFGEIYSAYEIMFNVWLQSKEPKIRLAIVGALGHMSHLMAKDKLEEQALRLLQGITAMYKKNQEHHIITQSMCMVLDAATADNSQILLSFLDNLLNGIYAHACNEPNYADIHTVKNYNEVLRCFQVLTKAFSDRVVGFLLQKLESGNEKSKAATLNVMRHIIYSADELLQNKREVIISGLGAVLNDSSVKIRKALAQVITAMAHNGYLSLEGGDQLVEFIARQCSLAVSSVSDAKSSDLNGLKLLCENILHLLTTTVEIMEEVLWPYLLQLLVPVQYTEASACLCKSLSFLATKKREEESADYQIDFAQQVNIPRPPAIIARLIVLAGYPHNGNGRGAPILKLLQAMSLNLHPAIVEMWDTVIPKLFQYLEENSTEMDNWNQKAWEDLILKTLSEIEAEDWNLSFGRFLGEQIALYQNYPEEKGFLYKCIGVVLRKTNTADFVREHLNLIFATVDHSSQIEREGCAMALGFCAASHLDQCLVKLEEITKTDMVRKSTGFMGFMKDKTEADVGRIKCTVALSYGYVIYYGPTGLITSRLETSVLRVLSPYFTSAKDPRVKQNLVKAASLFGKALSPDHLNTHYVFAKRDSMIKFIQGFLLVEPRSSNSELRPLAIEAITNLVILDPKLPEQEVQELIKICSDSVFPALENLDPDVDLSEKTNNTFSKSLENINELMTQISAKDGTPEGLKSLVKHLEPFLCSCHNHERKGAIQTVKAILDHFMESVTATEEDQFSQLGLLLGKVLPRCTDPLVSVRKDSIDCIHILLNINDRYQGIPADVSDERLKNLSALKENVSSSEASDLFNVVNELATVLSKKTPDRQLKHLIYSLLDGLTDKHAQSSNGACAILNCILKHRGAELYSEITKLITEIHNKLLSVSFPATITGTIVAMRTLASHHLIVVLTAILGFPLPFSSITKEFWQTLAKDKDLTQDTFDHLLDILSRSPPFTEKEDARDKKSSIRTATVLPIAVTCALTEIFRVPETEDLVATLFPKLFSAILLRMGSCLNVKPPLPDQKKSQKQVQLQPLSLATECCKEFLARSEFEKLLSHIEEMNGWKMLEEEKTFATGLEIVVRGLCDVASKHISDIVTCLLQALQSTYDTQRVVAAGLFAELINQRCRGDLQLVELLINSMLSKLVDPCHLVRKLCIKGLGNVSSVGGQKLQTYSTTILSAMMAGMDDKEDPENTITLEAMSGLSRILAQLDETSVRQILINICLRIRPCFEKESKEVRAASISLFGDLSRFGTGASEMPFLEQIHTNFISILLHLDEEPEVSKACKETLRKIGPRLGSASINESFQKHLIEGGMLHYGEFTNNLSRLMIADFQEKVNFYVMGCVGFFKSSYEDIRSNAATLTGFLLGNLPTAKRDGISDEHVCSGMS